MLESPELEFIMEAHNGLSAKIVEEAGWLVNRPCSMYLYSSSALKHWGQSTLSFNCQKTPLTIKVLKACKNINGLNMGYLFAVNSTGNWSLFERDASLNQIAQATSGKFALEKVCEQAPSFWWSPANLSWSVEQESLHTSLRISNVCIQILDANRWLFDSCNLSFSSGRDKNQNGRKQRCSSLQGLWPRIWTLVLDFDFHHMLIGLNVIIYKLSYLEFLWEATTI